MADGWDDGEEPYQPWNQDKFAEEGSVYQTRLRWVDRKRIYEAERRGDDSVEEEILNRLIEKDAERASGCFVATSAFENQDHPTVDSLRQYRDEV